MICGFCPFTDGMCYTSNPPKRKCTITGEFHLYDDECNCEYSRLLKEKEKSEESLVEPITTFSMPCLICGEDILVDIYGMSSKVCDSCREAVQFVKDKLMGKNATIEADDYKPITHFFQD